MRVMTLPRGRKVILSDTVGFISDLPTALIAAFRATLEEVVAADVILHVRDVSHNETEAQAKDVLTVLDELGISEARREHMIEVWNKADRLEGLEYAKYEASAARRPDCVLVSAVDGTGIDELLARVEERLGRTADVYAVSVAADDGKGLAWLHRRGEVIARKQLKNGKTRLEVRMDEDRAGQAKAMFGRAMTKLA
jgi:GTPase